MNIKNLVEIKNEIKDIYEKFKDLARTHLRYVVMVEPRIKLHLVFSILMLLINIFFTVYMLWVFLIVIRALIG